MKLTAGLAAAPQRRFTRWHLLGLAVLVFGVSYGVCRIVDWLVVTDEERLVALAESLAARARDGRLDRLLDDVRLADFGFSVGGWGEDYSYGAGQEGLLLAQVREWAQWAPLRTLQIKIGKNDVQVEGDRARADADLVFVEDGRPWRQPVHMIFRKQGDRWYATGIELVRPDEILRL